MKLRSYLMLFALATLLPVAVFAVIVGALMIDSQRDTFRRGAEERTLAVLSTVEVELRSSISTVEALAVSPTLDEPDTAAFRSIASSVVSTQPNWITINLALPTGQQVMNLNLPAGAPLPMIPAEDESVARVVQTQKPAIGDMLVGPTTKRWDFAVRVPIVRDGAVKYILSAVINPSAIQGLLTVQNLPPDWIGVVLDRNDRIVARTVHPEKGIGQLARQTLREALAGSDSGWYRGNAMDGAAVYTPYRRSETTGWTFAMDIPAQAVEQVERRAQGLLAVGLLTALALALALAVVVGERIASPISSLAGATKAMGQGRSVTLPADIRVSEVETLMRALQEAEQAIRERQSLIEREREALQAADRSKDEFLAMLSHELRTPLAALTTAAHVLRVAGDDVEKATQARGVVERQTRHMARLVEDLLDVSRVNIGKAKLHRETFDFAEVIENLVAAWRAAGRFDRHHVTHATAPVWINADRTRIEQIVSNLLDNALKFTPPGRRIDLSVRQTSSDALLQVADEGEGLAPAAMSRIFELFVQGEQGLDRRRRGMGIGLALVKRLSEMHGGTVSVTSKGVDQGATFTVRLPAVTQPHDRAERAVDRQPAAARRILIIEDNDDTRQMLRAALTLSGHEVLEGHDGATGLATAATAAPDIVLIDIGLPDIDGYEVARRLRASPSNGRVPLIALSGYGQAADLRRAFEAGFNSHLTKPVAVEQLHSAITAFNEEPR
ncbi:MAG TPA: ATP-binding protein [Burkholderiales bacterium]|nr:ATP-binding protein [Burkholderiales bacterium]